ncbi:MAG: transglycosylase SLT domain-containing protein [Pyrinomonadaceae bacterium]
MKRLFGVMILIAYLCLIASSQPASDFHKRVIISVEARDYSNAITELQTLQKNGPEDFFANDYDYLLARIAESSGRLGLAMGMYQSLVDRDSVLGAYALSHMSQIARSTGNLLLERILLKRILLFYPGSLLSQGVNQRIARNNFECGNYDETIRILTTRIKTDAPLVSKTAENSAARENQGLLAEAYLRSGKSDLARELFTDLIDKTPNSAQPDDVAQTAAMGLDLLDGGLENFGRRAPDLSESEHLRRASIYQFNRDFAAAKLHLDALIARFPNSTSASDALFQIGRGFAQQGKYVEALGWFERIQEQYPDSATAKDALLQAASAYARVGKSKIAIQRYRSFIDKYPADEKLERAYLNIVDIYRDQAEDQEALKWCAKTQEAFKGRLPEAVALFAQARIHIAGDKWPDALNDLDRLATFSDLGGTTPGGTNAAEVTFIRAYVLEQMKRYPEAIDVYLSIADGRGEYYGWRATERLRMLGKDENAASFVSQKVGALSTGLRAKDAEIRRQNAQSLLRLSDNSDVRENALSVLKIDFKSLPRYSGVVNLKRSTAPSPHDSIAARLLFLGLYDEAAVENSTSLPDGFDAPGDNAFTLATNYAHGDRGDRAMAYMEPIWKKFPADYPVELMPPDQLELLYPAVYKDSLMRYAPEYGIDPRLVLAVVRQESRFQPDAKSYAAARGLMQFISTTSDKVAGELGRNNFRQEDLYYPPTAILFGSRYLDDLFKIFPNQAEAVVAGYNGGDDNMKRWLSRSRSNLPERYVPEIMFPQSKDYVYRVMANYRMYQLIYDEQLRPR